MKQLIIFYFFILIYGFSTAQSPDISIPDKLNSRFFDFEILGKNSEGIIILKYGKGENNIIEAYSDNMILKWKKTIEFRDKNVNIEKMVALKSGLLLVYTVKTRDQIFLFAQKMKDNLDYVSEMLIDSVPLKKISSNNGFYIRSSKDKTKFLIYRYQSEGDKINYISAFGLDDNFSLLWRKNFDIDINYMAVKVEKSLMDNSGNPVFVFNTFINKPKKQNEQAERFTVLQYDFFTSQIYQYKFSADSKFISDSYFEIDNLNKTLNGCGFYSEKSPNTFSGIFYWVVDLEKKNVLTNQFKSLSPDIFSKLLVKYSADGNNELSDFEIKNLVLRNDGGVILIAEMFYKTIESRTVPNVYGNYSYVDYDYFHFQDIMIVSVNPDGSADWNSILRKKQISEEDEGYYSSFASATSKDELHFIFNEDIFKKTNIIDYQLSTNGKQERRNILNAERKELMLMPRFAKQISANEIIVPSLDRNFVKFVKFTL